MKKILVLLLLLIITVPVLTVSAHGWVGGTNSLQSRQELCSKLPTYQERYDCGGNSASEKQSVGECADKSFENGQLNGRINSCNRSDFANLDVYNANRNKNQVTAGQTYNVVWYATAPHRTTDVVYYISNPGADLTTVEWSDFETAPIAKYDYYGATLDTNYNHSVTIPTDHVGDQMIIAAWDVYDTGSTFYNMIDLSVANSTGGNPVTPPTQPVCEAPTGLSASNTTETSTTLNWNKGTNCANNSTTYKIYQNNNAITTTTSTSFAIQNLAANTTYSFVVEDMITGKRSEAISITTKANVVTPQPETCKSPLGLHSMETTMNTVSLMWNMSSDCMNYSSSFEVYQNGYFIGTVNSTSFKVNGLTASTAYNFHVKDTKNGQISNTYSITTLADPNQGGIGTTTYPDLVVGKTYNKGDKVTHNGVTKEVIQKFTYYGDPNWWNAPSLFKAV